MSSHNYVSAEPAALSAYGFSLFESLLPNKNSKKGRIFFDALKVPSNGDSSRFKAYYQRHLVLATLMLGICQESAESIQKGKYKKFDALVRNSGCQITGLQNFRTLNNKHLFDEARRVHALASDQIAKIRSFFVNPPHGKNGMEVTDYLKSIKVDVQLSKEMADLVRCRILNIVNMNVLLKDGKKDQPNTKSTALVRRVDQIKWITPDHKKNLPFGKWIEALQVEESERAVTFIQQIGEELEPQGNDPRVSLIKRMLGDDHVRRSNKLNIASLPQLYTGEAALRGVHGIVLLKNKLTLCDNPEFIKVKDESVNSKMMPRPIQSAQPMTVYVKMPEGRVLSQEEVMEVSDLEPIVVLEAYIKEATPLEDMVRRHGIATLLGASLAKEKQYASGNEGVEHRDRKEEGINDPEAKEDIEELIRNNPFLAVDFDHIYCASMEEERDCSPAPRVLQKAVLPVIEIPAAMLLLKDG